MLMCAFSRPLRFLEKHRFGAVDVSVLLTSYHLLPSMGSAYNRDTGDPGVVFLDISGVSRLLLHLIIIIRRSDGQSLMIFKLQVVELLGVDAIAKSRRLPTSSDKGTPAIVQVVQRSSYPLLRPAATFTVMHFLHFPILFFQRFLHLKVRLAFFLYPLLLDIS